MPRKNADVPIAAIVIGVCIVEAIVERIAEIDIDRAMVITMAMSIAMVMTIPAIAVVMSAVSAIAVSVSAAISAGDNGAVAKVRSCRKWCAAQAAA